MNLKLAAGSVTRLANTTAYAANDLLANHATAGSVVPIAIAVARVMGGRGRITRAALLKSNAVLTNAQFRIHLFNQAPAVTNGDNGAFAVTNGRAKGYLGSVDVTVDVAIGDGAQGDAACDIIFDAAAGSLNVYALIEVLAAYGPASAEIFTIQLDVERP